MVCGAVLAGSIVTTRAKADEWNKRTVLTVNEPIQIRDTYLEPGKYVLKLYNSPSERHVVQIFNGDETHIINTVLAIPKERYETSGHTEFTFWETPAGKARALRSWFYPGDQIGQEFPYPKHLRDVAMTQTSSTMTQSTTTEQAATTPQPATNEMTTEENKESQNVETAQNTPPPPVEQPAAPPAETPAAAPSPASYQGEANRSAELPKTASPYPLIGLSGLLLIGLSGLLRLRRTA